MEQELRQVMEDLVLASHRAYTRGIQTGSGGNVSARVPGRDQMIVKASGGSLGDVTADSGFVICDLQGNLISGTGKPTKEATLHGLIYRLRPDVKAVVHVHAPYANSWSVTLKPLPLVTWHSRLKLKRELPVLDVHSAMVRQEDVPMVRAMMEENPELAAFVLVLHGIVAMAGSAVSAEHTAELVEETAQVAVLGGLVAKLGL